MAGPSVRAHPYLTNKGVAAHGLRQDRRGNLLVPMRDVEGRLWSVQTISATGQKLYMKGGRKQGTHAVLGELRPGAPLVIAEGYATAATLREVTGLATVAAFDSGNLMDVARAYRERDPERPIIFAADNDHHLPNRPTPLPNVGKEKATAAAEAVNGLVLLPSFAPTETGTDWNDFMAQHGRVAMRQLAEAELTKHGIALPAELVKRDDAATRATVTQADRDAARQRAPQATARQSAQAAAPEGTAAAPQRADLMMLDEGARGGEARNRNAVDRGRPKLRRLVTPKAVIARSRRNGSGWAEERTRCAGRAFDDRVEARLLCTD